MTPEDAEVIRTIRRELGKRPLDSARIDIQVVQGRVTLAGIVSTLRDHPDTNLQSEMELLTKLMMRDRLVKDFSCNARLIQGEKEDKDDKNTRGRMRGGH